MTKVKVSHVRVDGVHSSNIFKVKKKLHKTEHGSPLYSISISASEYNPHWICRLPVLTSLEEDGNDITIQFKHKGRSKYFTMGYDQAQELYLALKIYHDLGCPQIFKTLSKKEKSKLGKL